MHNRKSQIFNTEINLLLFQATNSLGRTTAKILCTKLTYFAKEQEVEENSLKFQKLSMNKNQSVTRFVSKRLISIT